MPTVSGVNGDALYFSVAGEGPALVLGYPFAGPGGPDAAPADAFLEHLVDRFRVIVAHYPRGIGNSAPPAPDVTTADHVSTELLAIASAADADRFAYWGYSWGGVTGLQLACRTDRLTALVIGGWPPLGGPYDDMRAMTAGAAANPDLPADERASINAYAAYYRSLEGWDDNQVAAITCPKLVYVGGDDVVVQGGVTVRLTDLVEAHHDALVAQDWSVHVLPGLDHAGAMYGAEQVVPPVRAFLERVLL